MTMLLVLFLSVILFLKEIDAKIFRLKHPKQNLYLGGPKESPYFVDFADSYLFEDIASVEKPVFVRILVPELENNLWVVLKKEKFWIETCFLPHMWKKTRMMSRVGKTTRLIPK